MIKWTELKVRKHKSMKEQHLNTLSYINIVNGMFVNHNSACALGRIIILILPNIIFVILFLLPFVIYKSGKKSKKSNFEHYLPLFGPQGGTWKNYKWPSYLYSKPPRKKLRTLSYNKLFICSPNTLKKKMLAKKPPN